MKILKELIFFLTVSLTLLLTKGEAQVLSDDFNGMTVNTNIWNVILPFAQSQITESGGSLTMTGKGTLATVAGFNSPYEISGSVTLNNSLEHFSIVLRSDLSVWPPDAGYDEFTGINVVFSADGNQISIQQFDPSNQNPTFLALTNFNISVGQPYNFKIIDTGTRISLAINGTTLLTGQSTFSTGNKIAFRSREFSNTSSSLDYVSITATPTVEIQKAVYLTSNNLIIGSNYVLQISADMQNWTNFGSPFTATTNYWRSTNYWDVADWNSLFFRFQAQ